MPDTPNYLCSLEQDLPSAWKPTLRAELKKDYVAALETFLAGELRSGRKLAPSPELIFRALQLTPPEQVKVVILGQDPYPTPGFAHGLAFSVRREQNKIPGSLRNLYRVLTLDTGIAPPPHGELSDWAKNGVLLLNTVLTVCEKEPNSHAKKGWENLTLAIVESIASQSTPAAFFLMGKSAQKFSPLIDEKKHLVVQGPHPSPLNGRAFVEWGMKNHPFRSIDRFLESHHREPVDWRLT